MKINLFEEYKRQREESIKDNEIKGKIVFRLFPFTKIGTVQ